jgi:tetratricopeptide (TPR) repeat protein
VGDHDVYATLIDAAAMQHDAATIWQYASQAEEQATRYGHVLYQAIVQRARGVAHRLAGEFSDAYARLQQALALFSHLNTRWQIGRTLFELGELALVQGSWSEARGYFIGALAAFEAQRAEPDVRRTRTILESLRRHH